MIRHWKCCCKGARDLDKNRYGEEKKRVKKKTNDALGQVRKWKKRGYDYWDKLCRAAAFPKNQKESERKRGREGKLRMRSAGETPGNRRWRRRRCRPPLLYLSLTVTIQCWILHSYTFWSFYPHSIWRTIQHDDYLELLRPYKKGFFRPEAPFYTSYCSVV